MALKGSTISDLSCALLADILSRLSLDECQVWRVSRSWRRAAAMATKHVYAGGHIDSVSAWLAANCPDAALTTIAVEYGSLDAPSLQLPVQHMQHLAKLRLDGLVRVSAVQYSSPHAAAAGETGLHPLGLASLTALRELKVNYCDMRFGGLSALTGLQSLNYSAGRCVANPWQSSSVSVQELAAALPALQRLTSLSLAGKVNQDAVVQQIHSLASLQNLYLGCACTASSFQQMPPSLTKLVINVDCKLSVSTSPGVSQLTALKQLWVQRTNISVELLANMTALQDLRLSYLEGPGSLSVLTGLTQLQHLALPEAERLQAVLQSPADRAAITASSQLTYLDINTSLNSGEECFQAFQGSRQLPHLVELRISLPGLCDEDTAARVLECCPNLERLWIGSEDLFDDRDHAEAVMDTAGCLPRVLALWAQSDTLGQSLTSLRLALAHCCVCIEVWPVLANLTQLRSLCVLGCEPDQLPGMLDLYDCCYLTKLEVGSYSARLNVGQDALVHVTCEAAEDGTTRMHEQLYGALHTAVLQLEEDKAAYPELLEGVLACDLAEQQRQQRQIADLQARLAESQASAQQQVAGLQQLLQESQQQLRAANQELQNVRQQQELLQQHLQDLQNGRLWSP